MPRDAAVIAGVGAVAAWISYFLATSPWRDTGTEPAPRADGALLAMGLGLAILTGFAFRRVLERPDYLPDRPAAIRAFLLTLLVGVVWAPLVGRQPSAALVVAALLAVVASLAVWRFARVDGRAAMMLAPWALACLALLAVQASLVLAPQGG